VELGDEQCLGSPTHIDAERWLGALLAATRGAAPRGKLTRSLFALPHNVKEWARDDDGDGVREVHCNSCEGAGTGLRTFLQTFRGVHKYHLTEYVATYETIANAKRITPTVIRRMCYGDRRHTKDS
jgi:hypothetical protein